MTKKVAYIVDTSEYRPLSNILREIFVDKGYLTAMVTNEEGLIRHFIQCVPSIVVVDYGPLGDPIFDLVMRCVEGYPTRVLVITSNPKAVPFEKEKMNGHGVLLMPFSLDDFANLIESRS